MLLFYIFIIGHRRIYCEVGILHRDLSATNIMFSDAGGTTTGILNDFDLATILPEIGKNQAPTSHHQTGTAPYMARNLLSIPPRMSVPHLYTYELESFFYIILSFMLGYKRRAPKKDPLKDFYDKNWDVVMNAKSQLFGESFGSYNHRNLVKANVSN